MPGGDRQIPQERGIDVGSMNRAAADELFSGSNSQRQQGRFTRSTPRSSGGSAPQPGSVSPLRRRQFPADVVSATEPEDGFEQSCEENGSPSLTRHGERRNQHPRPAPNPPHLAPLRFPGEPVEPALPEELLGSIGSMTGNGFNNGIGNGRGSHSA